jgi:ATP-binding cassette subfamily B (MDR/TAP) protein 1
MALGRIVEQGTHHELLNLNSVYASLVQAQALTSKVNPRNRMSLINDNEKTIGVEAEEQKLALVRTATSAPSEFLAKNNQKDKEYGTWELIKFSWEMNRGEHTTMTLGLVFRQVPATNTIKISY